VGAIDKYGKPAVVAAARTVLAKWRDRIINGRLSPELHQWQSGHIAQIPHISREIMTLVEEKHLNSMKPVFNLTGTSIHTNLGRSLLPDAAISAMNQVAAHSHALEFDLTSGSRGDRDLHVLDLLIELTGAESATVVNNNAAAVLLVMNTLAKDSEVPISRGELVEIGGSFRIPDIMASAGCVLIEVGTTNRTYVRDYFKAIGDRTTALLKVHTSNYVIQGYSSSVSVPELSELARSARIPLIVDLGSGALVDLKRFGLPTESTVAAVLAQGADIVTFSGDKLLGGPQSGLIVGRRDLLERINANPLKRALRVDKLTMAALRAVLMLYRKPDELPETLPVLRTLLRRSDEIKAVGDQLLPAVQAAIGGMINVTLEPCQSQIGSGALPTELLPSWALCLRPIQSEFEGQGNLMALATSLRQLPIPVLGRLHDGAVFLDLRCLDNGDDLHAQLSLLTG
jgi:L-seryl-tRNA(Ser) seleniumtransferase